MKRTLRLRSLLNSPQATILMEAHDGLSSKLAAEAGFEAIWASGLSIAAALGLRDCNEASWTQILEVLEFMSDSVDVPILMDGDTGYGNFNNVRRLVRKLEQRNVAGVCLEDKLFPKTNSFIDGERQSLATVDEFCGKLRAAKDTQTDPDFVVAARTESFIAGWGMEEALLRANAYAESGADAILVHSKRPDGSEVLAFAEAWEQKVPLMIVPTTYPQEPLEQFVAAGIPNFIFANQSLRTVITALQRNLAKLRQTSSLMSIEEDIAPLSEVFRLQDMSELRSSERIYLPSRSSAPRALVLAASQGDFGDLVNDRPKCMVPLRGKPVLQWQVEAFRRLAITDIGVVRGYQPQAVNLDGLRYFDNHDYATTGELQSLYAARDYLTGDLILAYGDIVFDDFILEALLARNHPISIAVDAAWRFRNRRDARPDLVQTDGIAHPATQSQCSLVRIGPDVPEPEASGEWIGLLSLRGSGTQVLASELHRLATEEPEALRSGTLDQLLSRLVSAGHSVSAVHTWGHWGDLDGPSELEAASQQRC